MAMAYLTYEIKTFRTHYFDPKLIAMMPTFSWNEVRRSTRAPLTFTVFHIKGFPIDHGHK